MICSWVQVRAVWVDKPAEAEVLNARVQSDDGAIRDITAPLGMLPQFLFLAGTQQQFVLREAE